MSTLPHAGPGNSKSSPAERPISTGGPLVLFGGAYFGGLITDTEQLWLGVACLGFVVAFGAWWRSRFVRQRRQELAEVRARRSALPAAGTRADLAYVGALVATWQRKRDVSSYSRLPLEATKALDDEKRRVVSVIADEKRAAREVTTLTSDRDEWRRRTELASRAGDAELTREAAARTREKDEELAVIREQHARLLHLSDAEKRRLRSLHRCTESMKRRLQFLNAELNRAGRTRAAERAAVAFLQAVLFWRFALREPPPEVD